MGATRRSTLSPNHLDTTNTFHCCHRSTPGVMERHKNSLKTAGVTLNPDRSAHLQSRPPPGSYTLLNNRNFGADIGSSYSKSQEGRSKGPFYAELDADEDGDELDTLSVSEASPSKPPRSTSGSSQVRKPTYEEKSENLKRLKFGKNKDPKSSTLSLDVIEIESRGVTPLAIDSNKPSTSRSSKKKKLAPLPCGDLSPPRGSTDRKTSSTAKAAAKGKSMEDMNELWNSPPKGQSPSRVRPKPRPKIKEETKVSTAGSSKVTKHRSKQQSPVSSEDDDKVEAGSSSPKGPAPFPMNSPRPTSPPTSKRSTSSPPTSKEWKKSSRLARGFPCAPSPNRQSSASPPPPPTKSRKKDKRPEPAPFPMETQPPPRQITRRKSFMRIDDTSASEMEGESKPKPFPLADMTVNSIEPPSPGPSTRRKKRVSAEGFDSDGSPRKRTKANAEYVPHSSWPSLSLTQPKGAGGRPRRRIM